MTESSPQMSPFSLARMSGVLYRIAVEMGHDHLDCSSCIRRRGLILRLASGKGQKRLAMNEHVR